MKSIFFKSIFLFFCIPSRILLSYFAKNINLAKLKILGIFTLIPAITWILMYTRLISRDYGIDKSKKIWWNHMRLIHSIMYILFSTHALKKNKNAWIFLMLDAIIGFIAFSINYIIYDKS
jgi:hypothetical protein